MRNESSTGHRRKTGTSDSPDLLPDFCDNQVLLVALLVAEALAIVLTLSQAPWLNNVWVYLGKTSFFFLIIALLDAAVLCYSNRLLHRFSLVVRGLILYLVLQLVTVLVTIMTHLILETAELRGFSDYGLSQSVIRNLSISLIITGVMLRYFYVQHQNRMRRRTEEHARMQALQARIRPHFLFNSLNTIASLVHQNPDRAEEAIIDLAELFRSTLAKTSHITLAEELNIIDRYLRIEQLRLGRRLQVDKDIADDVLEISVPALLIQPLVENAVYHGIEPLADGGSVHISISRRTHQLLIKISNPLGTDAVVPSASSNQLALDNIRQRLMLTYGAEASMQLEKSSNQFCVTLSLPIGETGYANPDR